MAHGSKKSLNGGNKYAAITSGGMLNNPHTSTPGGAGGTGGGGAGGTGGGSQQLQPPPKQPSANSIPTRMLLYTTTGELVHIRFVESINFNQDEGDEIMGRLADDQIIKIRTTSGQEYEVSIREMIKLDYDERDVDQMVRAIRGCFQRQGS